MTETLRATVTYLRADGETRTVKEGRGLTYREALADADAQLPRGYWMREVVSTPDSIMADLRNDGRERTLRPRGEGRWINVQAREGKES